MSESIGHMLFMTVLVLYCSCLSYKVGSFWGHTTLYGLKKRKKANKKIKLNKIKGEKIQSKGTLFNHGHGVTKTGECLL